MFSQVCSQPDSLEDNADNSTLNWNGYKSPKLSSAGTCLANLGGSPSRWRQRSQRTSHRTSRQKVSNWFEASNCWNREKSHLCTSKIFQSLARGIYYTKRYHWCFKPRLRYVEVLWTSNKQLPWIANDDIDQTRARGRRHFFVANRDLGTGATRTVSTTTR